MTRARTGSHVASGRAYSGCASRPGALSRAKRVQYTACMATAINPTAPVAPLVSEDAATVLNAHCHCTTLDLEVLHHELAGGQDSGLLRTLLQARPHLFSTTPVFVSPAHVAAMTEVIAAVEATVSLPTYRAQVLQWAPAIAAHDFGPRGVFLGYDFHLDACGAHLIEININAGGALLNAFLARAQQACCDDVGTVVGANRLEHAFFDMFANEWRLQRGDAPLRRIAIVDTDPQSQYLQPEFLLFERLFNVRGIDAVIVDPAQLCARDGALWVQDRRIDLVYNRLTDFALAAPAHADLRDAYVRGEVVVTPHPRTHALYADKRNLRVLSDPDWLRRLGVDEHRAAVLARSVPNTQAVTPADAERFWSTRDNWFFKPFAGYGSKAVYRGDKLTRRVFAEIAQGGYVAQAQVAPSERRARGGETPQSFKMDWRHYVYDGAVQLLAARLYRGQTTNFRTEGGGFAPVFYPRADAASCMTTEGNACARR